MKNNYPDSLTIQQYLEGKLDPKAAHELEKQALDDPFLADALEGYSVYGDPGADLSIMQRQLHERIVHLQENKKVFDLTWQRLSVAAAAGVMFVAAGLLFWMNSNREPEQLASQTHKQVDVSMIDRDSVEAVINASADSAQTAGREPVLDNADKTLIAANRPVAKKQVTEQEARSATDVMVSSPPLGEVQVMSAPAARMMKSAAERPGEVAVASDAAKVLTAQPKDGWESYNQYLQQNTSKFKSQHNKTGSVLVSVEVAADGKLSNIKVVRSLEDVFDKEAERIIKDGPAWNGSPDGKAAEMMIEVTF